MAKPAGCLDVPVQRAFRLEGPSQGLGECPKSRPLTIKSERSCESIQPVDSGFLAVTERIRPNDRGQGELSFANQWFWIDDEPAFALGAQHVVAMQVLVDEHLLAL